jgi:methionyl aminopeptidase
MFPLSSALPSTRRYSYAITRSFTKKKVTKSVGAANASLDDTQHADEMLVALTPMRPYPQSPRRTVPPHILKPPYADTGFMPSHYSLAAVSDEILIHTDTSANTMRDAARLARKVLDLACHAAEPGVTTDDIDALVHAAIVEHGAYPSPLRYAGFPKSVCSSINEVICHGIPDARPLEAGDVVSFDVSCYLNGVHGDNCATVIVGDRQAVDSGGGVDWRGVPYKMDWPTQEQASRMEASRRLVEATREGLYAGIEACRPGGCLSDVGNAIHAVADEYGFDTVRKYRGHGIATVFHTAPYVKVSFGELSRCGDVLRQWIGECVILLSYASFSSLSTFATGTECRCKRA